MFKPLTGIISAVFFLTLASSAQADMLHADRFLEKTIYAERHHLTVLDSQSSEIGYLYAQHFENNNGKHRGFSIASHRGELRFGLVKQQPPRASQNPEPTAMVLLGTGLAAVGALARRKSRKRRKSAL